MGFNKEVLEIQQNIGDIINDSLGKLPPTVVKLILENALIQVSTLANMAATKEAEEEIKKDKANDEKEE